ncbi:MAG: DMT family transporter [Clostridia bacterium]
MKAENKAIIQMMICASLWSVAGIFIKLIHLNGFVIAGFRSLFAALTVLVYMRVKKERIVISKNVLLNAVFLAITFLGFVVANKLTTAANAIVLQFTSPVFILIGSALFLKERFTRADVLVVIATFLGIALFFFDQLEGGALLGNLIAVGAGLSMACMFLAVKKTQASERMSGMLAGHLLTALIGIPFLMFTENQLDGQAIGFLALLGVVQLGIPYILYGLAAEYCPPLACSLIAAIEPLLNPVWVAIFDGETPGMFALIGGVIVVCSITLWCVWKERQARSQLGREAAQ